MIFAEVPPKLEMKCKAGMYFSFNFGCYFIKRGGRILLNRKSLLSLVKVTSSPSLTKLRNKVFSKLTFSENFLIKLFLSINHGFNSINMET